MSPGDRNQSQCRKDLRWQHVSLKRGWDQIRKKEELCHILGGVSRFAVGNAIPFCPPFSSSLIDGMLSVLLTKSSISLNDEKNSSVLAPATCNYRSLKLGPVQKTPSIENCEKINLPFCHQFGFKISSICPHEVHCVVKFRENEIVAREINRSLLVLVELQNKYSEV